MTNIEMLRLGSPEAPQQRFDAIIVLGENIKKGWSPKEIRQDKFYLSPYSKANVLAASILYLKGTTDRLIFSTGCTSGNKVPSESEAMAIHFSRITNTVLRAQLNNPHLLRQLNSLEPSNPILETKSLSTSENAKEIKKIVTNLGLTNLGLLTVDFHLPRANYHFQRHGINATTIATEDILETVLPGIKDKFMNPDMVAQELKKERMITAIEKLPLGTLLTSSLARITRY